MNLGTTLVIWPNGENMPPITTISTEITLDPGLDWEVMEEKPCV